MVVLTLLACSRPPTIQPGGDKPDLVLISVDTLRADHVGVYGYERPTTPRIDALATRGVRFTNARSPSPWTLPAHTTMLTGLYPPHHQVVEDTLRVGEALPWLPEALGGAGYATGAFVSTLFVGKRFGFDRGFSRFEDFGITNEKENLRGDLHAEQVVDTALGWVAEHPGEPVFLFVHLYDAHYPYAPPSPHDERFDRPNRKGDPRYRNYAYYQQHPLGPEQLAHQIAQYDEEIRYADEQIGRLIDAFAAGGREAYFVLTADHGEEFGERGSWGHAHTLNTEQLHVPLIAAGPGLAPAVVDAAVGLHDLAATLAAWAGLDWSGDGLALQPAMRGEPLSERALLCDTSRFRTNRLGLFWAGLRLDWDLSRDKLALFADPAEREDLAAQRPEDVARLRAELVGRYGLSWEADAGVYSTKGAFIDPSGVLPTPLKVEETRRFALVPVDAKVQVGEASYRAAGGPLPPAGAPLRYQGLTGAGTTTLSEQERAQLEALGYLQGEE